MFRDELWSLFDIYLNTSSDDGEVMKTWASKILTEEKYNQFMSENEELVDVENFGLPIEESNFPIHKTLANTVLRIVASEACVERAFSKYKMVHSNLRANLTSDKLDDQLLVRYNFENVMDISSDVVCTDPEFFEFAPFDENN